MGVVFILGAIHLFSLDNLASAAPLLFLYLLIISFAAVAAWVYRSFLQEYILHKPEFKVSKVDRLSDQVMEITLQSEEAITFTSGQFYFFSFIAPEITRETHPFTVCSAPGRKKIKIMVKALGDYTRNLYRNLDTGAKALLEGPYGRFDYKQESKSQVWIAGGVGIAPFLSWVRHLKVQPSDVEAELYYCVDTKEQAVYLSEFKEFEKQFTGFNINLLCADTDGFLDARDIPDLTEKAIFICGPKQMRQKLLNEFKIINVPKGNIHYEDFDFF